MLYFAISAGNGTFCFQDISRSVVKPETCFYIQTKRNDKADTVPKNKCITVLVFFLVSLQDKAWKAEKEEKIYSCVQSKNNCIFLEIGQGPSTYWSQFSFLKTVRQGALTPIQSFADEEEDINTTTSLCC